MKITTSNINDIPKIFELYRMATEFMKTKNQVSWPEFKHDLIESEIHESRQWKLTIENEIACIWATALSDELIWGIDNNQPSVYIHRIATSPDFRGQKLVQKIVNWADTYCEANNLDFIRMDTVGLNKRLIQHYQKLGFSFLGTKELENTDNLPLHYKEGPVCLFQRKVSKSHR